MNTPKPEAHDFSLMQFSLGLGADGRPLQHVTSCGSFASVEAAFATAREFAEQELAKVSSINSASAEKKPVEMVDTEWGYDIRRGWLTVTRFWVHDVGATTLAKI
jgi:hypothetical protein